MRNVSTCENGENAIVMILEYIIAKSDYMHEPFKSCFCLSGSCGLLCITCI